MASQKVCVAIKIRPDDGNGEGTGPANDRAVRVVAGENGSTIEVAGQQGRKEFHHGVWDIYDGAASDAAVLYAGVARPIVARVLEGINGSNGAVTPSVALSGTTGIDGLFVVADQSTGGGTLVSGADLILNFDFQNGPDSVVLRDAAMVASQLA